MAKPLTEIFVLEERQKGERRWKHSSIYDPGGPLSHNFEWIADAAKDGRVIEGMFGTQYRVIRFKRVK